MPKAPLHPCNKPRCGALIREGAYCAEHTKDGAGHPFANNEDPRPSAGDRGYGHPWRKCREAKIHAQPLCEHCLERDEVVSARLVDHIIPLRDGGEPLDWENLQSLCIPCHAIKTANDARARKAAS